MAVLPGNDPRLKDEYVVFSAHLDHLGIGKPINGDSIYNGAMDNASGVAALLDVAAMLKETGTRLRRSVLFVAVTGEEKGLLGSRFFANSPTVDPKMIVADINTDMFLPLFPLKKLTIYGLDESELGGDAAAVAESLGIAPQADLEPKRNIFIRSDQYSFIRRGIPSLALKVGYDKGSPEERVVKKWLTERYHAPSDDLAQPVDKQAAGAFDALVAKLLERSPTETNAHAGRIPRSSSDSRNRARANLTEPSPRPSASNEFSKNLGHGDIPRLKILITTVVQSRGAARRPCWFAGPNVPSSRECQWFELASTPCRNDRFTVIEAAAVSKGDDPCRPRDRSRY